ELVGPRWQRLYDSRTGELWVLSEDGRAIALRGAPCG
ncbi:MAG: hypothetical protein H6Q89_18, partial [Myxococcaceae bacterium]|nr:hypothetical protein [Myxococcaceae bacterium]